MDTAQRVIQAFYAGCILGAILFLFFYLSDRAEDYAPTRWARWRDAIVMWSEQRKQAVRERRELVQSAGSTGSTDAVHEHQNQVELVEPVDREPGHEPIVLHNLSRESEIALLAVQRNDDDGYRHSANAIAAFVGGTKADVLDTIRKYRAPAPAPRPQARMERPADGWH